MCLLASASPPEGEADVGPAVPIPPARALQGSSDDGQSQSSSTPLELDKHLRIVNRVPAEEDKYPFVVSLQDRWGHFCGGTMVSRDVVLTAAHCSASNFVAVVGRHNILRDGDGYRIATKKLVRHPNWDDDNADNDFMLIFLKRAVPRRYVVKLNKNNAAPARGQNVKVMGWGTQSSVANAPLSPVLMEVTLKVITNYFCGQSNGSFSGSRWSYDGRITKNMMCAKSLNKDSCQGDSGGPLMRGLTQVGVVSWGIGCAHPRTPHL
ncbi:hypothetical protein ACHAWF_003008 [Thalassiosira exigua]